MGEKKVRTGRLIPIMSALSLVWIVTFFGLMLASERCAGLGAVWIVPCLSPNEIGDTLAGAFAPLAFAWLMAAVLLQRDELREQRRELQLTRREYELTRQEVAAQRTAMEAQVAQAQEQTALLRQERLSAELLARDNDMDEMLETLNSVIVDVSVRWHVRVGPDGIGLFDGHRDRGVDENLRRNAEAVINRYEYIRTSQKVSLVRENEGDLHYVADVLVRVLRLAPTTSDSMRLRIRHAKLVGMWEALVGTCAVVGVSITADD